MAQRAVAGVTWLGSGAGLRAGLRLVGTLVLARLLAPAEFGLMAAAMIVVTLGEVVARMGVGAALQQLPTLTEQVERTGFGLCLVLGAFFAALTFAGAEVSAAVFGLPALAPVLSVLSGLFLLRGLSAVSEARLRRSLSFRALAVIQLASAVANTATAIALAWLGAGVWALVGGLLVDATIRSALLLKAQPPRYAPSLDRATACSLLGRGTHFTLADAFSAIALKADYFVVARWLGPGPLGLYSRAYALMAMPVDLVGGPVQRVLFPSLARIQHDRERMVRAYERGIELLSALLLPMGAFIAVLSDELIFVLLDEQWMAAAPALALLAWGTYFRTAYKVSASVTEATGHARRNARAQAVYVLIVVVASLVGQRYGVTGVATGVLIAVVLQFVLLARPALQILDLSWWWLVRLHGRGASFAAAVAVLTWALVQGMRAMHSPAWLTLLAALAGCGLLAVAALWCCPRAVLGVSGRWLIRAVERPLGARSPRAGALVRRLVEHSAT